MPVFDLDHPSGNPTNKSPGGEPYNEINEVLQSILFSTREINSGFQPMLAENPVI
jgi:hypothetical protein